MSKLFRSVIPMVIASLMITMSINAQARKQMHASLPADCKLELDDGVILFTSLEIDDGCVVSFSPNIHNADVVIQTLILHGNSTLDLSPKNVAYPVYPKPGTPGQARNDPPTQRGQNGTPGTQGAMGVQGTSLKLNIQTLTATDGALWIKTDGAVGGAGGPGGDAAKGSAGPYNGAHCYDGGGGGDGGRGGNGGAGGSTAKVVVTVGPQSIAANRTPGVSPSNRPADASIPEQL